MVTIATFSNANDAHLLRMRLEADGIQAFVQDELGQNFVQSIGGVRVQVADEDAEAAREYLSDDGGVPENEIEL
jgi:hypothetical protein